jgi:hypothetical protein
MELAHLAASAKVHMMQQALWGLVEELLVKEDLVGSQKAREGP